MIKIVAMLKRKSDLSFDEFSSYYFDRHAPLCWSLVPPEVSERIVHYVQNHARPLGGSGSDAPYDCVTEIGFDDREGLRMWNEWYLGPGGAALRADEENFMDTAQRLVVVTDERRPAQPLGATVTP